LGCHGWERFGRFALKNATLWEGTEAFPRSDVPAFGRHSAQVPRAAGQFIRGVVNTTNITYGNRHAEVVAFLNSKDPTPPPMTRMANRTLVNVRHAMADTLVFIIETIHYLLVS
jgi:hypothetical protein